MRELQDLARGLLERGDVKVVIGYEEGPRGVRPAFITNPADVGRLMFDHRCVHDLATYLSTRRPLLKQLGRAAVVVKPCDARAVAGLLRESQVKREDVVLVGVRCPGVARDPAARELSGETVADRCHSCTGREPTRCDHVVGVAIATPPGADQADPRDGRIAELEAMPAEQRLAFFVEELGRCVRCHACRAVCPLCNCERCLADKTEPQWLASAPHPRGNFAWHLTRALHLAGRCVDCGECARACPVGIPIGLLSRKVALTMSRRFGHVPSDDPAAPPPIGSWRSDDKQEFIR